MNEQAFTKILTKALAEQEMRLVGYTDRSLEKQGFGLKNYIDQALADQSRDLRDYTDQRITSAENRIKNEILEGVGDMFDGMNHQFDNHEKRILKLETRPA